MTPRDPQYASGVERRPHLDRHLQTNVEGLHIVGAANGSPLLKTCINEGVEVVRSIDRIDPPKKEEGDILDLLIVGAGPAGLSAALEARKRGFRFRILEQGRPLGTIRNFPEGKKIYAEPASLPSRGELEFDDSTKEELLESWGSRIEGIEIVRGVDVVDIVKEGKIFSVRGKEGDTFRSRRVVLAVGRMGNPRKLGVPGEDLDDVYSSLLNPGKYEGKEIVIVGGGNSAAEAALALAERNRVTIVHRGDGFPKTTRTNREGLERAEKEKKIRVLLHAEVAGFRKGEMEVVRDGKKETLKRDTAFVLIGADPPTSFLKKIGVLFEGQFTWGLVPRFLSVLALVYAIYGVKFGLSPFRELYGTLQSMGLDPGFLYGILYTAVLTFFGFRALRKYRDDPYQVKRYRTLIAAQWLLYFLLPWILYYANYSEWWRTWGVTLTYPLGYYGLWESGGSLFSGSSLPWAVATLAAFLIVMPIVSIYHGKRFCAWICPCGGIADTLGDGWRQKAPRGNGARMVESSSTVILVLTVLASLWFISGYRGWIDPSGVKGSYKFVVDIGLASIVAITLYPFAGSRVWCRFFCPLAKWMELWGRWTGGKLAIMPNEECISCGECTRYCQMGIDVRAFAERERPLSNETTSCVFCGICVTVCPVDVLRVERRS